MKICSKCHGLTDQSEAFDNRNHNHITSIGYCERCKWYSGMVIGNRKPDHKRTRPYETNHGQAEDDQ